MNIKNTLLTNNKKGIITNGIINDNETVYLYNKKGEMLISVNNGDVVIFKPELERLAYFETQIKKVVIHKK